MRGLKRGENSYKSITFDRVELVAHHLFRYKRRHRRRLWMSVQL